MTASRMSMLTVANGLVKILNGSKDPASIHHAVAVEFVSALGWRAKGEKGWKKKKGEV